MIEWKWDDNGRPVRERDPSPAARELPLQGSQEGRKKVGDKVKIIPAANTDHSAGFAEVLLDPVEATVIQVNEERRWYRVEYKMPGGVIGRECFKY